MLAIGQRNIEFAIDSLENHKLRIVSSDLGCYNGRKVIFNSGDGTVLIHRQQPMRNFAA